MDNFGERKFTFDDILLIPDYAEKDTREGDTASKTDLFNWSISVPVITSPMETITGIKMMGSAWFEGAVGVHHRYCDFSVLREAACYTGGIAISPSMNIKNIVELYKISPDNFFVLDIAQGDTEKAITFCKNLLNEGIANIVSGNIVTKSAVERYLNVGVKYIRAGVGAGSRCLTRVVTGFGYPQASCIHELYQEFKDDIVIISDGGCKNTGDVIKAFALGAKFVMSGYLFAGTDECPDPTRYSGMASIEALAPRKKDFFIEGDTISVTPKGSVSKVIEKIDDAIKHACHYGGVTHYRELVNVEKILITENSYLEGNSRK
jgi:IMP dehydrogenase